MKLEPYLTPHRKISSKWIKDLNIRPQYIKFLEENIGGNFHDIGLGNNFMRMTPKPQATKVKIGKLDSIKIKNICASKDNQQSKKITYEMGENIHRLYI